MSTILSSSLFGNELNIDETFYKKWLEIKVKIDGIYNSYINLMLDYKRKENETKSNIIIIGSYDGAEHWIKRKDKTNIVSFSSESLLQDELKVYENELLNAC